MAICSLVLSVVHVKFTNHLSETSFCCATCYMSVVSVAVIVSVNVTVVVTLNMWI